MVVLKQKKKCVSPELSVLADGHHDQQVSQDAHQHDQRQEADQSHPLWHAVTMETTKRHHHNKSVRICREKDIVRQDADVKIHLFSLHREKPSPRTRSFIPVLSNHSQASVCSYAETPSREKQGPF